MLAPQATAGPLLLHKTPMASVLGQLLRGKGLWLCPMTPLTITTTATWCGRPWAPHQHRGVRPVSLHFHVYQTLDRFSRVVAFPQAPVRLSLQGGTRQTDR